jgi:hypothetical protein
MKMESYVDLEQYLDTEDDALSLHLSSPTQSNTNIRHFCPPKQIIDEDEGSIPQNPFLPQSILSPSEAIPQRLHLRHLGLFIHSQERNHGDFI